MRHVLAAGPVLSRASGVGKAAHSTVLIAPARRSHRLPAPGLRACRSAIHVAAVTATAQHHLGATPPAQKHPSRLIHPRPRPKPKCDGHRARWMQYSPAHRDASRHPGVGRGDGTYFPVGPSSRLVYFGPAIIGARVIARVAPTSCSPVPHTPRFTPRRGALQPHSNRSTRSASNQALGTARSSIRGKYPRVLAAINNRTALGVRRDKAALFQWVQVPPGECSSRKHRSSHGGNEMAEAFG